MLSINLARYLSPSAYRVAELLSDMAFEDVLTGAYSARYLTRYLEEQIAADESFVLTLFDLDNLPAVQDDRGPLEVDSILKNLGTRLKTILRGDDIVARHGQNGFAVVTTDRPVEEIRKIADAVRQRLQDRPIKARRGGAPIQITLSAAVTAFPDDAATLDGILETAQTTLFVAKHEGGNRVLLASEADAATKGRGATLATLPSRKLIGRDHEMRLAELFVENIRDRKSGMMLLVGDQRIGKTRLLKDIVGLMRGRGIVYLLSAGTQRPGRINRSLLYLVQRYYERHPATRDWLRRSLNTVQRKCLGDNVPLFAAWSRLRVPANADLRAATKEALEGTLVGMAREAPLVLMIDNIAEIDPVTLDALRPILRENKAPIGVIGTISSQPATSALLDLVSELQNRQRVKSIFLRRLNSTDIGLVLAECVPGFARPHWFDDAIREVAQGSPGKAEDLVRWLMEKEKLRRVGRSWKLQVEESEIKALLAEATTQTAKSEPAEVVTNATFLGSAMDLPVYLKQTWKPGVVKKAPTAVVPAKPVAKPKPIAATPPPPEPEPVSPPLIEVPPHEPVPEPVAEAAPEPTPEPAPEPAPEPVAEQPSPIESAIEKVWDEAPDAEPAAEAPPAEISQEAPPPSPIEEEEAPRDANDAETHAKESMRRAVAFMQTLVEAVRRGRLYPQWQRKDGGLLPVLRDSAMALLETAPLVTFEEEAGALRVNGAPFEDPASATIALDLLAIMKDKLVGRVTLLAGLEAREVDAFATELWSRTEAAKMEPDFWARFRERERLNQLDVLQRAYPPEDPGTPPLDSLAKPADLVGAEQESRALQALQMLSMAAKSLRTTAPEDAGVEAALGEAAWAVQEIMSQTPLLVFEVDEGILFINGKSPESMDGLQFFVDDIINKGGQTLSLREGIIGDEVRALVSVLSVAPDDPELVVTLRNILAPGRIRNFALGRLRPPTIDKVVSKISRLSAEAFIASSAEKDFGPILQEAAGQPELFKTLVNRVGEHMGDPSIAIRRRVLGIVRDAALKLKGAALGTFVELSLKPIKERLLAETDPDAQTILATLCRIWLSGAILAERLPLCAELCADGIKPCLTSGRLSAESRLAFGTALEYVGQGAGASLLHLLSEGTERQREDILSVLSVVGAPLAGELVQKVLTADKPAVRVTAARALAAVGGKAATDLAASIKADTPPEKILRILEVLEITGITRIVDQVRIGMNHTVAGVKDAAFKLLQRAPDAVVEDAMRFLFREAKGADAVKVIGIAAERKLAAVSTEAIRLAQATEEEEIAYACCQFFENVPSVPAAPALKKIFETKKKFLGLGKGWSDKTRAAAVSAARRIPAVVAQDIVKAALKESSAEIREAAGAPGDPKAKKK